MGADADVVPTKARVDAQGIAHTVRTPDGDVVLASRLVGPAWPGESAPWRWASCARSGRRSPPALERSRAPGRLERCDATGDDVTALVDYAHAGRARAGDIRPCGRRPARCGASGCGRPGSHEARPHGRGRGAPRRRGGGDQRPRTEDPRAIADAVVAGVRSRRKRAGRRARPPGRLSTSRCVLRRRATSFWSRQGHEGYQVVGTAGEAPVRRPDRDAARSARGAAASRAGRGLGVSTPSVRTAAVDARRGGGDGRSRRARDAGASRARESWSPTAARVVPGEPSWPFAGTSTALPRLRRGGHRRRGRAGRRGDAEERRTTRRPTPSSRRQRWWPGVPSQRPICRPGGARTRRRASWPSRAAPARRRRRLCAALLRPVKCHAGGSRTTRSACRPGRAGARAEHRFAVIEVGMSLPGEIAALAGIVEPRRRGSSPTWASRTQEASGLSRRCGAH